MLLLKVWYSAWHGEDCWREHLSAVLVECILSNEHFMDAFWATPSLVYSGSRVEGGIFNNRFECMLNRGAAYLSPPSKILKFLKAAFRDQHLKLASSCYYLREPQEPVDRRMVDWSRTIAPFRESQLAGIIGRDRLRSQ